MSVERFRVRLNGERPLLMHSFRLADPLGPIKTDLERLLRKRDKTLADHEQIAKGRVAQRFVALRQQAVHSVRGHRVRLHRGLEDAPQGQARQGRVRLPMSPLLQYDGPRDLPSLWDDKVFRLRFACNVNDSKVMRTRQRKPPVTAI